MRQNWVWLGGLVVVFCAGARGQFKGDPISEGYVTSVGADGKYAVYGEAIVVDADTKLATDVHGKRVEVDVFPPVYVGERLAIWGKLDKRTHSILATGVQALEVRERNVKGVGVIGAVKEGGLVRADGYWLRLSAATTMHWNEGAETMAKVGTNCWIEYKGKQGPDGTVTVDEAEVWPNFIEDNEVYLRGKKEFDAGAVEEKDKQSGTAKFLLGLNYKKLPAHKDEDLQARVNRVGHALIPAYQLALAEADPTRIEFRFQVVDAPKLFEGVSLASGIILVPFPAVTRLKSDTELATILADSIACLLEKQDYLRASKQLPMAELSFATTAGEILSPLAGIAPGMLPGVLRSSMKTRADQQSGRVSLWLLHDAGYDVREAPMAWWRLAAKDPATPITQTPVPERAEYLWYKVGTTFKEVP